MRMTRREKRLGWGAAVLLGAGMVWGAAIRPARERVATLERVLPEKAAALAEVRRCAAEYGRLEGELAELSAQVGAGAEDFELLVWLEEEAARAGCEPDGMRPREEAMEEGFAQTVVELEFTGVEVGRLTGLLGRIPSAPAAVVLRDLHVSRGEAGGVDASCSVVQLRRREE